jgi:quinol monooxygenase YgiN
MVILHQRMRSEPDKTDEVAAALASIVTTAQATEGVIHLDIARDPALV